MRVRTSSAGGGFRRVHRLGHLPRQRERRFAAERVVDETGRRHVTASPPLHGLRRLGVVAILHLQPAVEPAVRRAAHLVDVSVRHRRRLQRHAVAGAQDSVRTLVLVDEIQRAGYVFGRIGVPGIVERDPDQQRPGRERIQQIRPIDPAGERRHDVLLRIVGRPGRLDVRLREILGIAHRDDGGADAAVERREELCQGRAAGLAAAADALRIDFRARQQVVDPADAVPRAEQAEVRAEQDQPAAGVLVLAGSAPFDQ